MNHRASSSSAPASGTDACARVDRSLCLERADERPNLEELTRHLADCARCRELYPEVEWLLEAAERPLAGIPSSLPAGWPMRRLLVAALAACLFLALFLGRRGLEPLRQPGQLLPHTNFTVIHRTIRVQRQQRIETLRIETVWRPVAQRSRGIEPPLAREET